MESPVCLRSFQPLAPNRLKQTDRAGQVLLRRPLMEPSTSTSPEFCEQISTAGGSKDYNGTFNKYNPRFSDCTETYPPPPSEYCHTVDEEQGSQRTAIIHLNSNHDEFDADEEEVANTFSKKNNLVPSKSQVLFYLSTSTQLKIHHTGCELQITDASDFPLFDIWAEAVCCAAPVWVIESYGRRVLVLTERSRSSWTLNPRVLLSRRRRQPTAVTVLDWNGDIMAYFIPGDPFIIQDSQRTTIARCTRVDQQLNCWQCVLESSGREVASVSGNTLRFQADASFQLKLLAMAALARAVGRPRAHTNCFPFLR